LFCNRYFGDDIKVDMEGFLAPLNKKLDVIVEQLVRGSNSHSQQEGFASGNLRIGL